MGDATVNVVGRGPTGLFAAAFLRLRGYRVRVISRTAGSLALWGGELGFGSAGLAGSPGGMPPEVWLAAWSEGAEILLRAGVPVAETLPELALSTVTALGAPKPTFLTPLWQYAACEPEPACFVGLGGVGDAEPKAQSSRYAEATGRPSSYRQAPPPPGWRPGWGPLRFAEFFDTDLGMEWLLSAVAEAVGAVEEEVVLFPQVLGVERVMTALGELRRILGRPAYEYPLLAPSIGGIRVERRLVGLLNGLGVPFYRAGVASVDGDGSVTAEDGRRFPGDATILATGGVLGGGFTVDLEGWITDPVTGESVGRVREARDLNLAGYRRVDLRGDATLLAVGSQVGGWNPDRDHNGGAMILGTVHQAIAALEAR